MKRLAIFLSVVAIMGVSVVNGQAQPQPVTPQPVYPSSGGVYQMGGYYGNNRASTVGESHAKGMADVVRSQGQNALDNSAAAINYSIAQKSQIENRSLWTNTYFDMRATNRAARAAERGPRQSMEQLNRRAQRLSVQPLSPGEVDVVTGQINWPEWIQLPEFDASRAELDAMFSQRASQGVLGPEERMKAKKLTDEMYEALRQKLKAKEIPTTDYLAATKFLTSLGHQATLPAA